MFLNVYINHHPNTKQRDRKRRTTITKKRKCYPDGWQQTKGHPYINDNLPKK